MGSIAKIELPASEVRPHVPSQFALAEPTPGLAIVFVQTVKCEKIAFDGIDTGAATLQETRVPVRASADLLPAGTAGNFLLEIRTDAPLLAAVFATSKVKPQFGLAYEEKVDSLPITYDTVKAESKLNQKAVYAHEFTYTKGTLSRAGQLRVFHPIASEPGFAFIDRNRSVTDAAGDGRGYFLAAPGTFVAELVEGTPVVPTAGSKIHRLNEVWST